MSEETRYSDKINYELMLHASIQACQFAYRRGEDMQNEIGALEFLLSDKIQDKLNPRMEPILNEFEEKLKYIEDYNFRDDGFHNKHIIEHYKNTWIKREIRLKNGKEINELIKVLDELNMLLRQQAIPDRGSFSFMVKDEEDDDK